MFTPIPRTAYSRPPLSKSTDASVRILQTFFSLTKTSLTHFICALILPSLTVSMALETATAAEVVIKSAFSIVISGLKIIDKYIPVLSGE